MNFSKSFIKILQFGYVFLVSVGLVGECVFYNQLGIKILRFSSIMDILISPVATLIESPLRLLVLMVFLALIMLLIWFLHKKRESKWAQKVAGLKTIENLSEEQIENHFNSLFLTYVVMAMLSFFLGLSLAFGDIVSKRIKNNEAEYNTKIVFSNGESEQVYLLHTNSMYNFYFSKGNKNVKIAPIGTIKNIELTNNPKLQ
jgi:hypothetical protein